MSNIQIGTAVYESTPGCGETVYFTTFGEADFDRAMVASFGDEYDGDGRGKEFEIVAMRDSGHVLAKYSRYVTSWGRKTGVTYSEFVELRFERDEDVVFGVDVAHGNDLDEQEIIAEWVAA